MYIYIYTRHWPKTAPAVLLSGFYWRHCLSGFVETRGSTFRPCAWYSRAGLRWVRVDFPLTNIDFWLTCCTRSFTNFSWLCGGRQPDFGCLQHFWLCGGRQPDFVCLQHFWLCGGRQPSFGEIWIYNIWVLRFVFNWLALTHCGLQQQSFTCYSTELVEPWYSFWY